MAMSDEEKRQRRERRLAEIRRRTEGLRRWRDRFGLGAITHLEHETGLTFAAVSRIVRGKAQATTETAQAIERATGGDVKASEILGVNLSNSAPEAAA